MNPYYEDNACTLYLGDCRDVLPMLGKVDLILTDPPYGIPHQDATWHKRKHNRKDGTSKAFKRDYGNVHLKPISLSLLNLVIGRGEGAIIWGGNFFALPASSCWLVWDKMNGGNDFADCELAWTNLPGAVRKFEWRWNGMLQQLGGKYKESREHPTQKPLSLMTWCLGLTEGKIILDPFAGSGTTLVAAKQLGRKAIGIEIEERYCEIAAERLRNCNPIPFPEPTPEPVQTKLALD